ncbi:toxin-antitoxin system, toxin component [Streptomyces sp. NPDC089799]|uniref:toxin-antitoxin system, toxin component n=1 Tax=Streptomyces sp. NPDC089799 TaxID=3155066 RepID=UPI00341FD431
MRRHRDDLYAGVPRPAGPDPHDLFRAICAYLTESSGREIRLMLAPFPPGTVSGLWLDFDEHEVVVVEENTLPMHQMVILGHELWHSAERRSGRPGGAAERVTATAAGVLGDTWSVGDPVTHLAGRTDYSVAEERRAEKFGRLLAAKFRPLLLGERSSTPQDDLVGRIWASLGG